MPRSASLSSLLACSLKLTYNDMHLLYLCDMYTKYLCRHISRHRYTLYIYIHIHLHESLKENATCPTVLPELPLRPSHPPWPSAFAMRRNPRRATVPPLLAALLATRAPARGTVVLTPPAPVLGKLTPVAWNWDDEMVFWVPSGYVKIANWKMAIEIVFFFH